MKRLVLIVAVVLLGGACARGPEGGSGLRLLPMGGQVRVQHDESWRTVTDSVSLAPGDRVETGERGRALVELPGGTLELQPGTELRMGAVPELEQGSLLAQSVSGLAVGVGAVQVRAEEALYRLDRSFSLRVGVYGGEVALPGSGWDGTVGSLRQVGVVADTVPRGPVALQVDPSDPWDDRILGQAIEIGGSLERYQQGLADQLPHRGGRDAVARVLQLDPRAILQGVPLRAPVSRLSEALVASVVASSAAPARKIAPEEAFRQVMALRDLGASWIVVAAEWQVARSVLEALLQVTGLLSREVAPLAPFGGTGPGLGGTGGPSEGSDGTQGGGPDEPRDEAPPPPPEDCTDLVDCTIEDVLDIDLGDGVELP
jgi:hypothetical protein